MDGMIIPSLGKNLCCVIFHEVSSEVSSYFKSQPRSFPQPTQNPGFLDDESIFIRMSKTLSIWKMKAGMKWDWIGMH